MLWEQERQVLAVSSPVYNLSVSPAEWLLPQEYKHPSGGIKLGGINHPSSPLPSHIIPTHPLLKWEAVL